MLIAALIVCGSFVFGTYLVILSSFAILLLRKTKLVGLFEFSSGCHLDVFFSVSLPHGGIWVRPSLQCVIVAFPSRTYLLFNVVFLL